MVAKIEKVGEELTSKGGESGFLVVHMMFSMKILVKRLYIMQLPMHPINTKLYEGKINDYMEGICRPSDVEYPCIAFRPIMFNHVFRKRRKDAVQWHGLDCYKDLQEHRFIRRDRICSKVSSRSTIIQALSYNIHNL